MKTDELEIYDNDNKRNVKILCSDNKDIMLNKDLIFDHKVMKVKSRSRKRFLL